MKILILLLALVGCGGGGSKFSFFPIALMGQNSISSHDSSSGVTQISPGANGTQASPTGTLPGSNSPETNPNSASTETGFTVYDVVNGNFGNTVVPISVPQNSTLFRVKLFDAPPLYPENLGLFHFVLEYNHIESFFVNSNGIPRPIPPTDWIHLKVQKIAFTKEDGTQFFKIPNSNESGIHIKKGKHFTPIVRGVVLPIGNYKSFQISLEAKGELFYQDKKYKLLLENPEILVNIPFSVEAGKTTTVHSYNHKEYTDKLAGNLQEFVRQDFESNLPLDFPYQEQTLQIPFFLELVPDSFAVHSRISKLNVHLVSLSIQDKNNSAFLLNQIPTSFEVLSLRNGFVGLAGNNEIPPGEIKVFQVQLGRLHSMEVDGNHLPIQLEERTQNLFRFLGPFHTEGGNILEAYLHLDPSRSIFYTQDKGFVFDPYLEVLSTVHLQPEIEARVVSAIGKNFNIVSGESELILSGKIQSLEPFISSDGKGRNFIYTKVKLDIEKVHRGNYAESNFEFSSIGGEVDGLRLQVPSMPEFKKGERVLLFLKKYGDRWGVVRGNLGKVSL